MQGPGLANPSVRSRLWGNRRLVAVMLLLGVLTAVTAIPMANAHTPSEIGWYWTCSGGDGVAQVSGNCWEGSTLRHQHHSNANARFKYGSSVGQQGWVSQVDAGYQAWDKTNGHQFDFQKVTSGTAASVTVTSSTICGKASAVGCTSMGVSSTGQHSIEGSATIKFKSTMATNLVDDVSAHEFGHYLSLGHSDMSSATMWGTAFQGAVSLASYDRQGRCQIYGHTHGWWGGC